MLPRGGGSGTPAVLPAFPISPGGGNGPPAKPGELPGGQDARGRDLRGRRRRAEGPSLRSGGGGSGGRGGACTSGEGGAPHHHPARPLGEGIPPGSPAAQGGARRGQRCPRSSPGGSPGPSHTTGRTQWTPETAPSSAHASSPGLGPGVAPASPGRAWRQRHIPGPVSGSGVLPLALTPAGASCGVQLGLAETNQGPGRTGRCVRECVRVCGV